MVTPLCLAVLSLLCHICPRLRTHSMRALQGYLYTHDFKLSADFQSASPSPDLSPMNPTARWSSLVGQLPKAPATQRVQK